jgi:oligopeptide/dipeptide ABC transporter ATP-binding protein
VTGRKGVGWRENGERTPLIEVRGVRKHFPLASDRIFSRAVGAVRAVDNVSFAIQPGESVGLVGESGCGKSTIAKLILGLEVPSAGTVLFKGHDIQRLDRTGRVNYRRSVAAVFQDPWSSLNPWMRIADIVAEPLQINTKAARSEIDRRVAELLEDVGLTVRQARQYPHELSGGQRQRVSIARALALRPELVVLDEPVSALDVSIRAQVMNLLRDLQERYTLSYLLIAHHLATVKFLCHSLAVVYLGRIVEQGDTKRVMMAARHPYTRALITAALPAERRSLQQGLVISGEVPSPVNPPSGCHFHPRCPYVMDRCRTDVPELLGSDDRVRCFLYDGPIEEQGSRSAAVSRSV